MPKVSDIGRSASHGESTHAMRRCNDGITITVVIWPGCIYTTPKEGPDSYWKVLIGHKSRLSRTNDYQCAT